MTLGDALISHYNNEHGKDRCDERTAWRMLNGVIPTPEPLRGEDSMKNLKRLSKVYSYYRHEAYAVFRRMGSSASHGMKLISWQDMNGYCSNVDYKHNIQVKSGKYQLSPGYVEKIRSREIKLYKFKRKVPAEYEPSDEEIKIAQRNIYINNSNF